MANRFPTRGSEALQPVEDNGGLKLITDINNGDRVTLSPLGSAEGTSQTGVVEDGPIEEDDGFAISGSEITNVTRIRRQGPGQYIINTEDGQYSLRKESDAEHPNPQQAREAETPPQEEREEEQRPPAKQKNRVTGQAITSAGDPAHKLAKSIVDAMERSEMERLIQRERDKGGFFRSLFLPNKIWEKVRTENNYRVTPEIRKLVENYAIRVVRGRAVDASSEELYRLMENYGFRTGPNGEFLQPQPQGGIWQLFQRANPSGGTITTTAVLGSAIGGLGSFIGGALGGGIAGGIFGFLRGRRESEEAFGSGEVWLNEVNAGLDSGIESEIELACHKVELLMNDNAMKREFFRNRTRMEAAQLLVRYQEGIRRLALRRMASEFEEDEQARRQGMDSRDKWTGGEQDAHIAERYAIFCREMAESETKFTRKYAKYYTGALARELGIIAVPGAPGTPAAPVPLNATDAAKRQELLADMQGQINERRIARRRTYVGAITTGALIGLIPGAIGGAAGGLIGPSAFGTLSGWIGLAAVGTGGAIFGNKYIDRVRRKMEMAATKKKIGWGADGAGGYGPFAEISSFERVKPETKKQEAPEREPRLFNRNRGRGERRVGTEPLRAGIDQLGVEIRDIETEINREQERSLITNLVRNYDDITELFGNLDILAINDNEQMIREMNNLAERILERKRRPEFSENDEIFRNKTPEEQTQWAKDIAAIVWAKRRVVETLKRQRQRMTQQREGLQRDIAENEARNREISRDEEGNIRWQSVNFKMRIGRHTEKKGRIFGIRDPLMAESMNFGVQNEYGGYDYALPEEGVMLAQREGRRIAEEITNVPGMDNAVYYFVSSNQARTHETNSIIGSELRWRLGRNGENPHVFNMWVQKDVENVARQITPADADRKILILEKTSEAFLGMDRKTNLVKLEEILSKRYNGDEDAMMREWMESYKLQDEIGCRPDEIANNFKRWIRQTREKMGRLFPDRPVVISAIGHSWEIDAAIIGLIGRQHTMEEIDNMGGIIQVMEGATITIGIDAQGNNVSVLQYRGGTYNLELEEEYLDPNETYRYLGGQKHQVERRATDRRGQNFRMEDYGNENAFINQVLLPYINDRLPEGQQPFRNGNDYARRYLYNSLAGMAEEHGCQDIEEFVNYVLAGNEVIPNQDAVEAFAGQGGGGRGGNRGGGPRGGNPRRGNNPPNGG